MRKPLLGDVSQHAPEDRYPDPAGDKDIPPARVPREKEVPLRLLDLHLGSDRHLRERALERGVAHARAEAEHATIVRRGEHRNVPPGPALVVVGWVEQGDPEVLPRREVDLSTKQVEHYEQSALRDLAPLLDPRQHVSTVTPPTAGKETVTREERALTVNEEAPGRAAARALARLSAPRHREGLIPGIAGERRS